MVRFIDLSSKSELDMLFTGFIYNCLNGLILWKKLLSMEETSS